MNAEYEAWMNPPKGTRSVCSNCEREVWYEGRGRAWYHTNGSTDREQFTNPCSDDMSDYRTAKPTKGIVK